MSPRTLYNREDCPFCWKVRLAFAASSVQPTIINVARGERNEAVELLSETRTIPVYQDEDVIITQSQILVEYISEAFCKGRLFLGDAVMKSDIRSLCHYVDTVVGASLKGLVFEKRDKPDSEQDGHIIEESRRAWYKCLDKLEDGFRGPHYFGLFSAADCALLPRLALANRYGAGVTAAHPKLIRYFQNTVRSDLFIKSLK